MNITAYKGFDLGLKCRGYQYVIGETFKTDAEVVKCTAGGFHACEYPLDVFNYYPPGDSRYAEVSCAGAVDRETGVDTKIACGSITITAELRIPDLVARAVEWIAARLDKALTQTNTGDLSAATNTGVQSAATNTGVRSAATNTGVQSAATNTGDLSAATNTGYQSAATNTGDLSAATNTGDRSAAEVSGKYSVAISTGIQGRARASKGSAIVLCYRTPTGILKHIKAAIAGTDGVKPNVWYSLNSKGEFVEVQA